MDKYDRIHLIVIGLTVLWVLLVLSVVAGWTIQDGQWVTNPQPTGHQPGAYIVRMPTGDVSVESRLISGEFCRVVRVTCNGKATTWLKYNGEPPVRID